MSLPQGKFGILKGGGMRAFGTFGLVTIKSYKKLLDIAWNRLSNHVTYCRILENLKRC